VRELVKKIEGGFLLVSTLVNPKRMLLIAETRVNTEKFRELEQAPGSQEILQELPNGVGVT
jgi:hypothetical protein